MTWKLWVDDQWNDPNTPFRHPSADYHPAATVQEAIDLINELGLPAVMQLDHDLGDAGGKITTFLRWLVMNYPDGPVPAYQVHSKNSEGAKNAVSILESWKKSLE